MEEEQKRTQNSYPSYDEWKWRMRAHAKQECQLKFTYKLKFDTNSTHSLGRGRDGWPDM